MIRFQRIGRRGFWKIRRASRRVVGQEKRFERQVAANHDDAQLAWYSNVLRKLQVQRAMKIYDDKLVKYAHRSIV